MPRARDVAHDPSRDDDVGATEVAAHDAAVADDDRRTRLDVAFNSAVDAKSAVGREVTAHDERLSEHVLDRLARRRPSPFAFRSPAHVVLPGACPVVLHRAPTRKL